MEKDKKIVVIVEDDSDLLMMLGILLSEEGYQVKKFKTVETAIKGVGDLKPHALIVDLMLPGKDGDHFVKFAKSQESLKRAKAILISADERVVESAKDSGADEYLKKPFSMDKLLNLL